MDNSQRSNRRRNDADAFAFVDVENTISSVNNSDDKSKKKQTKIHIKTTVEKQSKCETLRNKAKLLIVLLFWFVGSTLYVTATSSLFSEQESKGHHMNLILLVVGTQSIMALVVSFGILILVDGSIARTWKDQMHEIVTSSYGWTLVYAISHFVGMTAYIVSFDTSTGQVILAQIVKAGEPLMTAVLNFVIFGVALSFSEFVPMILITAGVLSASMAPNATLADVSIGAILTANISFCLRNVFCKNIMKQSDKKTSALLLFAFSSAVSFTLAIIGIVVLDWFKEMSIIDLGSLNDVWIYFPSIFNIGLFNAVYQTASFLFLASASVIDHSLMNASKRIVILAVSTVILSYGRGFHGPTILGIMLVSFGSIFRARGWKFTRRDGLMVMLMVTSLFVMMSLQGRKGENHKGQAIWYSGSENLKAYSSPQKLCYYHPVGNNFGDEMGPEIIRRLVSWKLQRNVTFDVHNMGESHPDNCLVALGSIFHFTKPGDYLWGSGVNPIHTKCGPTRNNNATVFALRGHLSKEYIEEKCVGSGIVFPESDKMAFGDPALLMPFLFPEYKKSENPRRSFCIIPHYHDKSVIEQLLPYEEHIMWPREHYQVVIPFIMDCSLVLSSSLHGIIVAEAFGIPARWFMLPESKTTKIEGTFKYNDYYSATNRSLNDYATSIKEALQKGGKEPIKNFDYKALADSFPYHLF